MPTYITLSDGQGFTVPQSYTALRGLLLEKTTATIPGVVRGPGNPVSWVEIDPGNGEPPLCVNPANTVLLRSV